MNVLIMWALAMAMPALLVLTLVVEGWTEITPLMIWGSVVIAILFYLLKCG